MKQDRARERLDGAEPVDAAPSLIRFVILAAPRTGSNWVCSMLNSHPEILCHHEIFNPAGIHYALDHRNGDLDIGTPEERDRAPEMILDRLWQTHFDKRVVGFKLNLGQDRRVFERVLADAAIKKLVLLRRNRIRTYVSEMIAEKTGRWESYDLTDSIRPTLRIDVDLNDLMNHIERNRRYFAGISKTLETSGQSFLQVEYEDLMAKADWSRLLRFLGVSSRSAELKPGTRKQSHADLRELIVNFVELESALQGSELGAELCE